MKDAGERRAHEIMQAARSSLLSVAARAEEVNKAPEPDIYAEPDVIIEVYRGIAEIKKQPDGLRIQIIDHDNHD